MISTARAAAVAPEFPNSELTSRPRPNHRGHFHIKEPIMANYHTLTVVQQTIPTGDMTTLERLLLSEIFHAQLDDDGHYFSSDEGASSIIFLEAAELRAAVDDPAAKGTSALSRILDHYGDAILGEGDVEIDTSEGWWEAIFQDILKRSATLTHVSVVSSFTCDKMRPDGFGGMALSITATNIRYDCTTDMLKRFYEEADKAGELQPT
jgi:hypothetical protein